MSSPGDTIQALSHNTIILASATWTSQAFVLGAYNSMSVMVKTDQPGTLTIQWSGDGGINYDNVNSYLISAGISRTVETPVLQKVVQVSFTNSSISNQTYFRLTTYATVTNTSISINSPDNVFNTGAASLKPDINSPTPIAIETSIAPVMIAFLISSAETYCPVTF